MKKYLIILPIILPIALAAGPAFAYSTTVVPTYFQANSIYVDNLGYLTIDWQKIQLGLFGYDLPSGDALIPMINATTTLPGAIATSSPLNIYHGAAYGPTSGCFSDYLPIPANEPFLAFYGGSCAAGAFGSMGTNNFANQARTNTVWDGNSGAYVLANTITPTTKIYFVLVSGLSIAEVGDHNPGFGGQLTSPTGYTYLDAIQTVPNFITRSLSAVISLPAANDTTNDFNNWLISMNNTATTTATGTVYVSYAFANATNTILGTDSSTFTLAGSNSFVLQILKTTDLYFPQASGTLNYVATLNVSTTAESFHPSTIAFGINGTQLSGPCDVPAAANLTNPLPSSTITNDFTKWKIATPQLLEGCKYNLQIIYQPVIGSQVPTLDQVDITVTPDFNPASVEIFKSRNLWNFYNATTTKINYSVALYNKADGVALGGDPGSFYFGYSATSSSQTAPPGFDPGLQCGGVCTNFGTIGSGVGAGSITTPSTTIAKYGNTCTAPADWTDIGGGLTYAVCGALNYLFVPNETTNGIIAGDMNVLENVPPFSWFFATNDAIKSAANDSAQLTSNGGVVFTIESGINHATTTLTALPADLTKDPHIGPFLVVWFNFILTACVIGAIIMLYKIAL